jgi:hypothetical protein
MDGLSFGLYRKWQSFDWQWNIDCGIFAAATATATATAAWLSPARYTQKKNN